METFYKKVALYWASDKICIRDFLSKYKKKVRNKSETTCAVNSLKAIRELMQADLTMPQLKYLADVCSPEKLSTDHELKSLDVKMLKSKPYLFEKVEANPNSGLKTQIAISKLRDEGKPLKKSKYRGNIWNIKEKSSKIDLKPSEEVLIVVRVFQPFKHRNNGPNNALPRCIQEIYVLGQQSLCFLRDTIACVCDVLAKECSDNPNNGPAVLAKDLYKSGFFFIDETFFNDFRCPRNIDYSEVIRKWALDRGLGQLKAKRMEETKFIDLSVHLGYPYVYQHQGNCEHLLVFSDIRLLSASDSLSSQDYPLLWSYKGSKTHYCIVCGIYAAKWIVYDNNRVPYNPAYFCDTCFKSFNYIDGAGDIPSARTVMDKYIPQMRAEREEEMRTKLQGQKVALFCDETTNKRDECVFVVLLKVIKPATTVEVIVGDVHTLETADSKSCSRAILDTLKKLNIEFDNVVSLVSDSARYMIKCFQTLSDLLPDNVLVVQCWAHKLNLVLNVVGKNLPNLHTTVAKVKSSFLNTRKRKHLFRNYLNKKYPGKDVPLFPMPVLTRWSSWYESVSYLADHLNDVVLFMKTDISGVSNAGVDFLQNVTEEQLVTTEAEARFMTEVGRGIVQLITSLEGQSYPTVHILDGGLRLIEQTLKTAADGVLDSETTSIIERCSSHSIKHKIKTVLSNAALHGVTKLNALRASDTTSNFYKAVSMFDPSELINLTINEDAAKRCKKLSFCSNLSESEIIIGMKELQRLVKQKVSCAEKVDIISMLTAMAIKYTDFAHSVNQLLWMPCANVDCERFFSVYNNVLSDKRHRLTEQNVNLYTEMYFEK